MKIRSAVPELITDNIINTVEFYTKILGLELVSEFPKENPQWVKFKIGESYVMFESRKSIGKLIPEYNNKEKGGTFNLYFEVENIEELYNRLKRTTNVVLHYIKESFKQFAVKDNNGYILLFGEHN